MLDRLAAERELLAIDLPGFGESPELPPGVPATAANLGACVSGFCEELGIERPHLVGNSLGGWVALVIAKTGVAASICCISPAGLWRRPLGPRRYDARGLGHRLRPLLPLVLSSRRARRALLRTTLARPERLTAAEARGLVTDWLGSPGYEAANQEMRAHVFEDPQLVTVPTTIAWGDADRLLAPPRPERMPPDARYLVLEGCGHTPTWDDPDAVVRLVLEASSAEPGEVAAAAGA